MKVREQAEQALAQLEVPTRKWEAWKYTQLKAVVGRPYQLGRGGKIEDLEPYVIPGLEGDRLVFINGHLAPEWSDLSNNQDALQISSFSGLKAEDKALLEERLASVVAPDDDIFAALNTAFAAEGTLIRVPKNHQAVAPIQLIHVTETGATAALNQFRNFFLVESGASAQIVATHHTIGEGQSLSNTLTEVIVEANADLEYVNFQLESDAAARIERTEVRQAADSNCQIYTFTFSGDVVRNHLTMWLDGSNIESHLKGTYLLSGQEHVDNFTQVHHMKPNCYSNELYKGIMSDQSTGVFSGKIHVYEDAQKTNAYQSNRNILLSDTANIYTKPQLEIYADDVKCSHGATTGRLDRDAMFYLQARGIPAERARLILIHAFAMEVAEELKNEAVKAYLDQLIEQRF